MNPQQMYEACTDALGAFVRGAGFTDVVIGLSGGMDSTLVAVMAADALGADHVHGVMLPGPYSSESSIDDAEALACSPRHLQHHGAHLRALRGLRARCSPAPAAAALTGLARREHPGPLPHGVPHGAVERATAGSC